MRNSQNLKKWNITDNTIITKDSKLLFNNTKLKKNHTNYDLLEYRKIFIVSPTINIANKQCYIFEPPKRNLNNEKTRISFYEKINKINERMKSNDVLDKTERRPRIRVRINSINHTNITNISSDKKNNNKNITEINDITEIKDITPINIHRHERSLTSNYSFINNINRNSINLNNTNSISNSNIFNFVRQNFQATKNNLLYNDINEACLKYNKPNEKNFKLLPNQFQEIKNVNNNRRINRYYYNKNNRCFYQISNYNKNTYTNHNRDNITFNKINNLQNIEITNNNKDIENKENKENQENKNNITKITERKKLISSTSLKSINEDKINISKLVQYNIKKKDFNSMMSPRCNNFQKTYQRKLIKKGNRGLDKSINNKNDLTLDKSEEHNRNTNNESSRNYNQMNMRYLFQTKNFVNNSSLKNIIHSKDFNVSETVNKMKEKEVTNNNYLINRLSSSISNKNLYTHDNYYNYYKEEKEDTNDITEIKATSDNNFSTSNSFYKNLYQNNNNYLNQKLNPFSQTKHKLKNLITSIDYKNKNNDNSQLNINHNLKNIILYEVDEEGKVNYKVKEMKNSVEKVVRDNSEIKKKSKINDISQKVNNNGIVSLYVKKNQGTVLRKFKDKNKIEFYRPKNKKPKK